VERLFDLQAQAAAKLGAGTPIGLGMKSPTGGHAVLAYQMAVVDEFGYADLFLYDNNAPFASLDGGVAPSARRWPYAKSFA